MIVKCDKCGTVSFKTHTQNIYIYWGTGMCQGLFYMLQEWMRQPGKIPDFVVLTLVRGKGRKKNKTEMNSIISGSGKCYDKEKTEATSWWSWGTNWNWSGHWGGDLWTSILVNKEVARVSREIKASSVSTGVQLAVLENLLNLKRKWNRDVLTEEKKSGCISFS